MRDALRRLETLERGEHDHDAARMAECVRVAARLGTERIRYLLGNDYANATPEEMNA